MNGTGFLWKGMADRFASYNDQKLRDDEATRERGLKREQMGWDALTSSFNSGLDRKSREKVSADRNALDKDLGERQMGLGAAASVTNTLSDRADFLLKQAAALENPEFSDPTPQQIATARQYRAEAASLSRRAMTLGLGIGQKSGIAMPAAPAGGGLLKELAALKAQLSK